jgi:hypothetical protein
MSLKSVFQRSERVWIETTRDNRELQRSLTNAKNEIARLTGFLTVLAAPVPFTALSDPSLREMGIEFSKRLLLAQQGLRGESLPTEHGDSNAPRVRSAMLHAVDTSPEQHAGDAPSHPGDPVTAEIRSDAEPEGQAGNDGAPVPTA